MPNAPEDAKGARPIIACFTNFKVSHLIFIQNLVTVFGQKRMLWGVDLRCMKCLGPGECFEAVKVSEGVPGDLHH